MCGIYRIINKINNKSYIGQSKNICVRWNEHYLSSREVNNENKNKNCSIIHKALNKYGVENFTFEVLTLCNPCDLNDEEKYFISYYNTLIPNGYNIEPGGHPPSKFGSNNHNSKMNENDIYKIRESYALGDKKNNVYETYKDIISINTFNDIWQGKTWTHIHMDVYTLENKQKQKNNYDKISARKSVQVLSDEDILKIRHLKNDGYSKKYVHNQYYSNININTFNDIWYNMTFKHIISDHPIIPQKRHRNSNQDGALNPHAKFSEKDIIYIRSLYENKDNHYTIKSLAEMFNVSKVTMSNILHYKTYKNIRVQGDGINDM